MLLEIFFPEWLNILFQTQRSKDEDKHNQPAKKKSKQTHNKLLK